jgi:hypothetical protein
VCSSESQSVCISDSATVTVNFKSPLNLITDQNTVSSY